MRVALPFYNGGTGAAASKVCRCTLAPTSWGLIGDTSDGEMDAIKCMRDYSRQVGPICCRRRYGIPCGWKNCRLIPSTASQGSAVGWSKTRRLGDA